LIHRAGPIEAAQLFEVLTGLGLAEEAEKAEQDYRGRRHLDSPRAASHALEEIVEDTVMSCTPFSNHPAA
jgi:hypothetical protein